MGNPASWNRYAYTLGDPINLSDSRGLSAGDSCSPGSDLVQTEDGTCVNPCDPSIYTNGFLPVPNPACYAPGADEPNDSPADQGSYATHSMYLVAAYACTGSLGNTGGGFGMQVTYQLMVDGAAVNDSQMRGLGIRYISERLTNPTGDMTRTAQDPAKWCLASTGAPCAAGQRGSLGNDGRFVDELGGNGTLTQSFYINGIGAALNVVFPVGGGQMGPPQSATSLNNSYSKNFVSVGDGLLTSNGKPSCH